MLDTPRPFSYSHAGFREKARGVFLIRPPNPPFFPAV